MLLLLLLPHSNLSKLSAITTRTTTTKSTRLKGFFPSTFVFVVVSIALAAVVVVVAVTVVECCYCCCCCRSSYSSCCCCCCFPLSLLQLFSHFWQHISLLCIPLFTHSSNSPCVIPLYTPRSSSPPSLTVFLLCTLTTKHGQEKELEPAATFQANPRTSHHVAHVEAAS